MKIVLTDDRIPEFKNKLSEAYFPGMNIGVFDIETLGLSASRHPIILSGFCYFNKPNVHSQYTNLSTESFEQKQLSINSLLDTVSKKDSKISKSKAKDINAQDIDSRSVTPKDYIKHATGQEISDSDQYLKEHKDQCACIQYFADDLGKERDLLTKTIATLRQFDVIVTFNGAGFDLPYVKKRAEIFDIPFDKIPYHLDLYQVIRNYSDIRSFLPNLKQKTVEKFMGLFSRTDEISGKESINLYYDYLTGKNPELKRKILLHNSDDVFQLYRLMDIIKKTDFHRAMNELGFPVKGKNYYAEVREARILNNKFTVKGFSRFSINEKIYFGETLDYRIRPNKTFDISMDLFPFRDYMIADLRDLDCSNSLIRDLPGFSNGYLVVAENNTHTSSGSKLGNSEFNSGERFISKFNKKSGRENHSIKLPEVNLLAKLLTERIFQNEI